MTLLTPEENQGVGDGNPGAAPLDSEDDLDSSLTQDAASLDTDDLSPFLPTTSAPVPTLKPVLDGRDILSGLEREKNSPSRFSVDAECESTVSDYSELGGPLRDIERDVYFMDREALKTDDEFLPINLSLLSSDNTIPVKQDEETEEEFEWRLRKINFLSLAQEFAELKKVDAQACPINFHRNQSAKTFVRGCSPLGSRGQSLERIGRRPHSKSPLRASRDCSRNNSVSLAGREAANNYPSQPKNHERKLLVQGAVPSTTEDLPVNEARRRNSTDLPANMRPDRCGVSPSLDRKRRVTNNRPQDETPSTGGVKNQQSQGSSDCEGDFEVYNMETALSNMNWQMLEEQLQAVAEDEKSRWEACKNDREQIRLRLAMATDDDGAYSGVNDDKEDEATFSPRKRLQARLQGAPSGMQICFMNEDVLDDEDAGDLNDDFDDDQTDDVTVNEHSEDESTTEPVVPLPNHPCFPGEIQRFTSKQTKLQSEATLALAQASTMAQMQLEVDKQTKKKSPIADMVGIPALGSGRRLHLTRSKLHEMNIAQLQVLVNDLHSQIELLNEDLVHLLIERDDLHMEQDSMLVDIEDLTSHCHDPSATNNNKSTVNNNRPASHRERRT